jgi:putative membrane-bound dehydrogenase-like protein
LRGGEKQKSSAAVISPRFFSFLLLAASVLRLHAADFPEPHNSETTPGEPMPALEAAEKWRVPKGFSVRVFAAEPDVRNPIAAAWDTGGRLWVVENFTYAERQIRWDAKLRDRLLIFEDTDGDGRHDVRSVFSEGIQRATSIELGYGGVWLMAPPQVLFIPDRDGDDRPDGPAEVVLDGFSVPNENHHNFANGLRWGPDGWLYGRCGASAPGLVGRPGAPAEERVPVAGGMWRYHPREQIFEALCHGTTNPWGHDWNEHGELFFINTVNGHLWHAIHGAHYTRPHTLDPNPNIFGLIDQHADHYHFDTGKGWAASRDAGAGSDAMGGGHAHCGLLIYQADAWPMEYRGKVLTLNFHGRRANIERLERRGSGYVGRHEPDQFLSADPFFRGIDLLQGPDGNVLVLDWSDTGECHENTGVHRTSGRIFSIAHESARAGAKPFGEDLAARSGAELAALHAHPNEWWVRMARRVLAERAAAGKRDDGAAAALEEQLASAKDSRGRIRALLTLHAMERIDQARAMEWLTSDDVHVRAWSVRMLAGWSPLDTAGGEVRASKPWPPAARDAMLAAASKEKSSFVRLAMTSALMRMPAGDREAFARALTSDAGDAADHNLPLLMWQALSPDAVPRDALAAIAIHTAWPALRRLCARRLAADGEKARAALDAVLEASIERAGGFRGDVLAGMAEGYTGWRKAPKPAAWDALVARIENAPPELQTRVRDLSALFGDGRALDEVRRLALDGKAGIEERKRALQTLIESRPDDLREVCENLLGTRFINTVAARGLALFDDPAIGQKLAKSYRTFHPSERPAVIETLVARPAFARALIEEMKAGRIPRGDLSAFHARQIRSFGDPALDSLLAAAWGELRETAGDKRAQIEKWKAALTSEVLAKADKSKGRATYETLCATCHTLYGNGGQIGPDLTGSGRDNLDYLLENLIDPGAVVTADFRLQILTLKDGRVLNGMVAARSERTITLQTMTERVTVETADILKQEELPQSLMPEGLVSGLSDEQFRDLIAYLMHPSQVPWDRSK